MGTTKRKKRRLMLDCDICGEPMELSPSRYVAWVRAGERPRCRRNGCERLCGVKTPGTARGAEGESGQRVGVLSVSPVTGSGGPQHGALAKLRVRQCDQWRYEDSRENG